MRYVQSLLRILAFNSQKLVAIIWHNRALLWNEFHSTSIGIIHSAACLFSLFVSRVYSAAQRKVDLNAAGELEYSNKCPVQLISLSVLYLFYAEKFISRVMQFIFIYIFTDQ